MPWPEYSTQDLWVKYAWDFKNWREGTGKYLVAGEEKADIGDRKSEGKNTQTYSDNPQLCPGEKGSFGWQFTISLAVFHSSRYSKPCYGKDNNAAFGK
jgi:hypothetical protein